jgi:hypothetical protein
VDRDVTTAHTIRGFDEQVSAGGFGGSTGVDVGAATIAKHGLATGQKQIATSLG